MLLYYFFILFIPIVAIDSPSEYAIDFLQPLSKKQNNMKEFLSDDVHIDTFIFNTEGILTSQECAAITGWKGPSLFSQSTCEYGIIALSKKKLFKNIHITIRQENIHTVLYCVCAPLHIVGKVKYKGIHFGKERFFSYYDVQVGEPFSLEKHQAALKKVREACHKEGYCNAKVVDTIVHNYEKHEVTITLNCNRGKRFVIRDITLTMDSLEDKQYEQIKDELYQKYVKKLLYRSYHENTLIQCAQDIQNALKKKGFVEPLCTYEYTLCGDEAAIRVDMSIKLGQKQLFTFVGNKFYSAAELTQILSNSGHAIWLLPPSIVAQDITLVYRKKGFWNVTVTVEKNDLETFFIITEGTRARVKDVVCKGLPELSQKNSITPFFKSAFKNIYFDEDILQEAVEKILALYRQEGFWDSTLTKKNYTQVDDTDEHIVTLLFNSGERRTVNRVVVKDFPQLERRGPFARINADDNSTPVTKGAVQEQQEWLKEYFRKQGHAHVQVSSVFDKSKESSQLVWNIDHLKTVYHGKTIVQGKSPISYEKLLAFVDYKEGDQWSKEALQRTYTNLRSLDIFKYIALYPDAYDAQKSTRDVILHVQEDEPYEVRFRLGFQQVSKNFAFKEGSTYKFGATYIAKNITRNADALRIDTDFTRFIRKVDLSYQIPYPFLFPITILTKVYANKYVQPIAIGSRRTLYEATQEGCLTSITGGYQALSYGSNLGFEWMKIKNISVELAQAINFKTDLIDKKLPYFFIEPTLFIDLLDDTINPTRGIFGVASVKGMIPVQEGGYLLKFMIEQGLFFPLIKYHDIICAARVRFGHIFNESFSKIVPTERFYLGGAYSLRGYLPDACPPLGTYIDEKGKTHYVPQGGKTILNMNFEVRVPFTKTIVGAVFQDFGILVEEIATLHESTNNATSTGFGVRYLTPIGPLRFDIGFKWKKTYEDESRYAWFLTLGNAF